MNRPVLVGFDGSEVSEAALDWAASEAARRRVGLRLLHALPEMTAPVDQMAVADAADSLMLIAEQRARRRAPDIEVTRLMPRQGPAVALIEAAADADLVVVGNRGHGGFTGLLIGSVAHQVAGHAPCPVALIPGSGGGTEKGIVVVGVGTGQTDAVLRAAFEEAALRGAHLRVVHGWRMPIAAPLAPGVVPPTADLAQERRVASERIEAILAPWQGKYTITGMSVDVVNEQPREILIDAGAHADLVVVGAHDDVGRHVLPLGSVAGPVAHHSRCPVLIAR